MRNRGVYKIAAVLCLLVLACGILSGCQLAQAEEKAVPAGDRLCGMFLADAKMVSELRKQRVAAGSLQQGQRLIVEGEKIETKEPLTMTYKFPGIKGEYAMILIQEVEEDGKKTSASSALNSDGVYDRKFEMHSDNGKGTETNTCTATVAISNGFSGALAFCNLYERADGSIYLAADSVFMGTSGGKTGTAQTYSEEYKVENWGYSEEINTLKMEFTLVVEGKDYLDKAFIKEMSSGNRVLRQNAVDLNVEAPQQQWPVSGEAAYLLVEEHWRTTEGETYIKRTVYDCGQVEGSQEDAAAEMPHVFYCTDKENRMVPITLWFVK